ncbi:MAG: hypothetical protein HY897_08445 [Deltaproteobacteria bacterium]|nr:hypothetical protein [Deltaproteobacteria bacterium]
MRGTKAGLLAITWWLCAALAAGGCATAGGPETAGPKPAAPSVVATPRMAGMEKMEQMEQGVQEPCVYCQVLYPARLAAHCPHCGDRRIVFRPARMMSRELATEHIGELKTQCSRMEEAVRAARPEARPAALSSLRRCFIGLLRDTLTYGVGESKPLVERIHALDADLGPAGVE